MKDSSILIRLAVQNDLVRLCALDHIARTSQERCHFIGRTIKEQTCYVSLANKEIAAYGVLDQFLWQWLYCNARG